MYTFSKTLFETDKSTPMTFNITKCKDREELKDYIEAGGGHVDCLDKAGPYTCVLLDDESGIDSITDRDVFSSEFIWRCCCTNNILPLKKFRLNPISLFPDAFDPADVLHHNITWHDATTSFHTHPGENHTALTDPKPQKLIDDSSRVPVVVLNKLNSPVVKNLPNNNSRASKSKTPEDSHSEHSSSTSEKEFPEQTKNNITTSTGPRNKTKFRADFTSLEREKIVEHIVKNNAFDQIKGTLLWKRMSTKFSYHTWQSLKNHFLRKILPRISSYKLPPDIILRFKNHRSGEANSSHSSVPGAYSRDEDLFILEYVNKNRTASSKLSGNEFWRRMETKKGLPGRSWHSMRQRYLTKLKDKEDEIKRSPTLEANRKTSRSVKQSYIDQHFSDEDEDGSNDKVCEVETIVLSPHEKLNNPKTKESKSSSEEDNEKNSKSIPRLVKKRKLFTAVEQCRTPTQDVSSFSPVSLKIGGPTMLDVAVRKHVAHQSYLKKKIKINAGKLKQRSSRGVEDGRTSPSTEENVGVLDESLPLEAEDPPSCAQSQDLFASSNEETVVHSKVNQVSCESSGQSAPKEGAKTSLSPNSSFPKEKRSSPLRNKNGEEGQSSNLNKGGCSPSPAKSKQTQPDSIKKITLPEWPSTFTAEKIVFVDLPSSGTPDNQNPSSSNDDSDTDVELAANFACSHDSEDDDFSVWSDDGVVSMNPRPRLRHIPNKVTEPQTRPSVSESAVTPASKSCEFVKPAHGTRAIQNFRRCSPPKELYESGNPESFDFMGDITLQERSQPNILVKAVQSESHISIGPNVPENEQETLASEQVNGKPSMVDAQVQTDPVQIIPIPAEGTLVPALQGSGSNSVTKDKSHTPVLRSAINLNPSREKVLSPPSSPSRKLGDFRDNSPASRASCSPNAANRCTRSAAKYSGTMRQTRSYSKSPRSCGVHSPKYKDPPIP